MVAAKQPGAALAFRCGRRLLFDDVCVRFHGFHADLQSRQRARISLTSLPSFRKKRLLSLRVSTRCTV